MREVALRFDTYNNQIAQSPKADPISNDQQENQQPPLIGDLFQVVAEFDLHSVMSQTYLSMRPARPKAIIRKFK